MRRSLAAFLLGALALAARADEGGPLRVVRQAVVRIECCGKERVETFPSKELAAKEAEFKAHRKESERSAREEPGPRPRHRWTLVYEGVSEAKAKAAAEAAQAEIDEKARKEERKRGRKEGDREGEGNSRGEGR